MCARTSPTVVVSPLTALIQVSKYGSAGTMADHRHWQREAEGQPLVYIYSASSHLTALIKSPADYDCAFHNSRIYDVVRTKLSVNSYQTLLFPLWVERLGTRLVLRDGLRMYSGCDVTFNYASCAFNPHSSTYTKVVYWLP